MTPKSEGTSEESRSGERPLTETDGGVSSGFDDELLYSVVRTAVKDAVLDVIGTLLLVGVGFVLVAAGAQAVIQPSSLPQVMVGVWIAAIGVYLAATALELIPPIRDWF
jgi:hypothetical protein